MRLPPVLRYALTGGLAAAVDIGGFAVLAARLGSGVRGGVPGVMAAAVGSFLLAAGVNYLASARWVFGSDWRHGGRALKFLLGACLGLCANTGVTTALALLAHWPPLAAKVAGVALAFGLNFTLNARWVFASRPEATVHATPGGLGRGRGRARLRRRRRGACADGP